MYLVQGENYEKRIERLTLEAGSKKEGGDKPKNEAALKRERIIRRAALEFEGNNWGGLIISFFQFPLSFFFFWLI